MQKKNPLKLSELASLTGSQLIGDPAILIYSVADLETATPKDASFLANPRYLKALTQTQAGVVFVAPDAPRQEGKNYLITPTPSTAFQQLVDYLHPPRPYPSEFEGIHPTAVIHPTAKLAEGVVIGPHAVIDGHTEIGEGTFIGSGVYIGPHVLIGRNCLLHPRVVVREGCILGDQVILQPGAVIGSCGFGYHTDEKGNHQKLNQVGNVHIGHRVEIGANATIDRARFGSTVIGDGTKIDNLVQIGHNVELGQGNIIVAQTGIAGSTVTGKYVVLAGQVAVAGHLHLADGVQVAGKSGVSKSLPTGKYSGIPVMPIDEYNRNQVLIRKMGTFVDKLKDLEKKTG